MLFSKVEIDKQELIQDIKDMGPRYYQDSEYIGEIYKVQAEGQIEYEEEKQDVLNQLSPFTATWGLVLWEEEVGIKPLPTDSLDIRRARVVTRIYSKPSTTLAVMERLTNMFVESKVQPIPFRYAFDVFVPIEKMNSFDIKELYKTIEIAKPAHLDYIFNVLSRNEIPTLTSQRIGESFYPICGIVDAGTKPLQQNMGKVEFASFVNITKTKYSNIMYPEVATVMVCNDTLFPENDMYYGKFAEQCTSKNAVYSKEEVVGKEVRYIKCNEVISGIYPGVKVYGSLAKESVENTLHIKTGFNMYHETGLAAISEYGAVVYQFANQRIEEFKWNVLTAFKKQDTHYPKIDLNVGAYPSLQNYSSTNETIINNKDKVVCKEVTLPICNDFVCGGGE